MVIAAAAVFNMYLAVKHFLELHASYSKGSGGQVGMKTLTKSATCKTGERDAAGFLPDYPVNGNFFLDAVERQRSFCERIYPGIQAWMEAGMAKKVKVHMNGFLEAEVDAPIEEDVSFPQEKWPGGKSFEMWVRAQNDVVAHFVEKNNDWQPQETRTLLNRLELRAREIRKKGETVEQARRRVALLDVGANQGWFSMVALARGFSVVAIEAMPSNEVLFRSSVCANAKLGFLDRVVLFPMAVGDTGGDTCTIMSAAGDAGNGNVHCGGKPPSKDPYGRDLFFRGMARTGTLDDMMDSMKMELKNGCGFWHTLWKDVEIPAAKIDVEGFEWRAMFGGKGSFFDKGSRQIKAILIEYAPKMIQEAARNEDRWHPHKLLEFMEERGYKIRMDGFYGGKGKKQLLEWERTVGPGMEGITDIYFLNQK